MHLEAAMEWVWTLESRDFEDAFGGRNRTILDIHL